ncbi:MAG TPA: tungstate ABC transporter substrate-binding protein WtpA [Gemmatimonadales bacterium]|nr:tungstate ABC transporter substrate-binding protein WtpA [Gemmatimonadales bacterium]
MRRRFPLLLAALLATCRAAPAPQLSGPLDVFNAGSLGYPFRELLAAFARAHSGVEPRQESSGSLEAARKLTELGKIPDVLAVADHGVIAKLLMPRYTSWYASFASNAMVLAYSDRSAGAGEVSGDNWWRILLRPEVRWGSSDPALDPNGYRSHMVFQLAELHYSEPGLAQRLEAAIRPRYVRPNEAQLLGLVQAGELDYAWSYRSLAATAGLRWVTLPPEIDLSDPARAQDYSVARIRLPGPRLGSADSVEFRGEPILYAVTIPTAAPHPELARAFVQFVVSESGQAILRRAGFTVLSHPILTGKVPAIPGLAPRE